MSEYDDEEYLPQQEEYYQSDEEARSDPRFRPPEAKKEARAAASSIWRWEKIL